MKRSLLGLALTASLLANAQHNWAPIETMGFGREISFWMSQTFQGKLYVAGDSMGHISLHASATGLPGSFTEETGILPLLQPSNETNFCSSTANANNMFFASSTYFDTTGGFAGIRPQVYRFDGSSYTLHGTLNYGALPDTNKLVSGANPALKGIIQYSPTGSNDTIYAFLSPGWPHYASVWKAPANQTNPTWINSTNFAPGSMIEKINGSAVWHNKLYISAYNFNQGGMILRTADGVNWDTVTTALSMGAVLGPNAFNANFNDLIVHNDTLIAGVTYASSGIGLIYTADSLATTQTWDSYMDSAVWNGVGGSWDGFVDMAVSGGELWLQVVMQTGQVPRTYQVYKNAMGKDTIRASSEFSLLEDFQNIAYDYHLNAFNNRLFSVGHKGMGSKASGSGTVQNGMYDGNIYSFYPINPTASYIDSVYTGSGYCEFNTVYLVNTSQNASSYEWFINGAHYSWAQDTMFNSSTAGVFNVKMVAYNGTYASTYKDSTTGVITINPNPFVNSVSASSYTICQGQSDSLFADVGGGTGPYTYTWHNVEENLTYNGSDTTVITLYTVPSFSPYIYMYLDLKDANQCTNNASTVFIYVNPSDSLSGIVLDTMANPVMAGKVYLFKLNPLNPQPGDTAGIYNLATAGTYYFPSLLYGDYIAKAVADTSNPLYATAVGTYYSNKTYPFQWDSAIVIQHHGCTASNNGGNNINILQMPPPVVGPGSVEGTITEDSSYAGAKYIGGGHLPMGAPLKGVDVKLGKNPGGSPAARTTTDTSGHFSFTNIPLGSYKIYVDIPNYGMDSVRLVNLTPADSVSENNDYFVDSTMIRVVPVDSVMASICAGDSLLLPGGYYQGGAGTYSDTLNVNGHDSIVVTLLSVDPLPTLTVTTSADTVCLGNSAVLSAFSNATSLQWSANAGGLTTSTVSISPTATDTYTVTGTLGNCPYSKSVTVVVKSCIGIQSYAANGLKVYPNPAIDKLNVDVPKAGTFKLFDIAGQLILEKAISSGHNEINLGNLPAGAYEVSVNAGATITNSKLMISK